MENKQQTFRQRSTSSATPRTPLKQIKQSSGYTNGASETKNYKKLYDDALMMIQKRDTIKLMISKNNGLQDSINMLVSLYNQRTIELQQLQQNQSQTAVEQQVLQLLSENNQLVNKLQAQQHQVLDLSCIDKNNWKHKFIQLNKQYHKLQERLVLLVAEKDQLQSRSPSLESIEALLRF
ncbi:hypothetical protein pb186bvf_006422 [Paramecium bursaria]